MQQNSVIYPPNRPLDRIVMEPQSPVLEDHLFFVNSNNKGEVIFSSSDVCGTGWYGSLFYCNNFSDAINLKYSTYYNTSSCIGDGVFYKDDYVIMAADNRLLSLLSVDSENARLVEQYATETQEITEQIAIWTKSSRFVTATGKSVAVWNVDDNAQIRMLQEYQHYHGETVTSVDTDTTQPDVFYSTSADKKACMWDERMPTPATVIYTNEFSALNSISCSPTLPNKVIVGSSGGDLYLLDVRETKEFLSVYHCFKGGIHRTKFSDCGLLAVCGDLETLLVVTCEQNNLKVLYSSSEHTKIVRGITWNKGGLYSCGFDKKIVKHTI